MEKRSGIVFIAEPALLSDIQLNRLSEFCANLSVVLFGSTAVPSLLGIDEVDTLTLSLGVFAGASLLYISIWLIRGVQTL